VDTQRIGGQRVSRYQFAPKVIQSYIYGGLDKVELSYLHEDVGAALETLYGAQAEEIAGQLARHFERAGLPEKASHYLRAAGRQAAGIYATESAIDTFTRALALTPAKDAGARFALLLDRESLYDLQGRRQDQRADLGQLQTLAAQLPDPEARAEVAIRQASFANNTGDSAGAIGHAERAVAQLQGEEKRSGAAGSSLLARAHAIWGDALYRQGCFSDAKLEHETALALARGAGDSASEAYALTRLGNVAWSMGDNAQAGERFLEALAAATRLGDRRRQWTILNGLGLVAQSVGDYRGASGHYAAALDTVQSIGDRRGEATVLTNRSQAYFEIGQFEEARWMADRALEIARDIGAQNSEAILLANLADIAYYAGELDLAKQQADEALAISHRIGYRVGEGCALGTRGDVLLALGDEAGAEDAYTDALGVWNEIDEPYGALRAQAGLAWVALRKGGDEGRRQAGAYARVITKRLAANPTWESAEVPLGLDILLTAYRVLIALGDPEADTVLRGAHQVLQARAANLDDPEMRRSYLDGFDAHRALQQAFAERISKN
jgi:tetratricopeptide (TPR) repeat protein